MLRGFREDDLDAHAAILADPVVMQHFGGHLFGREDSWRRLLAASACGSFRASAAGVERKADGQ